MFRSILGFALAMGFTPIAAAQDDDGDNVLDGFNSSYEEVDIHDGNPSQALGANPSARAFSHGNEIAFQTSDRSGANTDGQNHLLAHELTHVIQQQAGNHSTATPRTNEGRDIARQPAIQRHTDRFGGEDPGWVRQPTTETTRTERTARPLDRTATMRAARRCTDGQTWNTETKACE